MRPAPSAAGNPRVEASIAFDRAFAQHGRMHRPGARGGARSPSRLPALEEEAPGWRLHRGLPHERVVAVREVVLPEGTAPPSSATSVDR